MSFVENYSKVSYLLAFSILVQSFSALSIKFASSKEGVVVVVLLVTAFMFLFIKAILWQKVIEKVELSVVYPYLSSSQILIFAYSVFLFKESVYLSNIIGLLVITIGLVIFSSGLKKRQ